jgi:hypothetical protein
VRRISLFIIFLLIIGLSGSGFLVRRSPIAWASPGDPTAAPIDPQVWRDLMASPEREVSVLVVMKEGPDGGVESAIPAQMGLEGVLRILQVSGGLKEYDVSYGNNLIWVRGKGNVVRYLVEWPDVAAIYAGPKEPLLDTQAESFTSSLSPQQTGQIIGSVTGPGGTIPLSGIEVRAYYQTGPLSWVVIADTLTAADGSYSVNGLGTGVYRARFRDPDGDYATEFYADKQNFELATNFEVTDGQTTPNIDASLAEAGHIAGTITTVQGGDPIEDIVATAWYFAAGSWYSVESGVTGSDGNYDIGGLASGDYRIRFSDPYTPHIYLPEYYDNVLNIENATDVSVTAGNTTTGIDAALGSYGSVSGTVTGPDGTTPLEGIYADVWRYNTTWSDWEWVSGSSTDSSGFYQAGGLDTGDYRAQFSDPKGQYGDEYYDNKLSIDTGDDVQVELGLTTSNINASLALAPDTVSQPLITDWNLISLPVVLDDPTSATAFSSLSGILDIVFAYQGCDTGDPWKKYAPGDYINDLDAVDVHSGYWVQMAAADDLELTGIHPQSTSIDLCEGWNLIGYPSVNPHPVTEVLAGINGKFDLVYAYDASDASDHWKKYNPAAPSFLNDLVNMQPWLGYWIHMTAPATLVIPGR